MYQTPDKKYWKGRVSRDGLHFFQVVDSLDLTHDIWSPAKERTFGFIGFVSDEGAIRAFLPEGTKESPAELRRGLATLPVHFDITKVGLVDCGNVICPADKLEKTGKLLSAKIKSLIGADIMPIVLGAGHETVFFQLQGVEDSLEDGQKVGIIDLTPRLALSTEGTEMHTNNVLLQLMQKAQIEQSDLLYLPIGIHRRSNHESFFEKAREVGQSYILLEEVQDEFAEVDSRVRQFMDGADKVIVCLSMEVFSAAFAPGVGRRSTAGMDPASVRRIMQSVVKNADIASIAVVDYLPRFDNGLTQELAASCILDMIDRLLQK
jgi:formiminoglutamase